MNHFELCKLTANRFLKESDVILYEYNTVISNELPDVLCFKKGYTKLFEIKISYSDFKADLKKDNRSKIKVTYWPYFERHNNKIKRLLWGKPDMKEFIREAPHLGSKRYYVCPWGMIQPDEVDGWGLYWVKNNKFYKKKKSKIFRRNIHLEIGLLTHAFRKFASLNDTNILINTYR